LEKLFRNIAAVFFGLLCINSWAQQTEEYLIAPDSALTVVEINTEDTVSVDKKREHLPRKATMYSAVLPGLGQAYNRQIWKVPFVYGGFVALGLTVKWHNDRYVGSKRSYIELNDNNPNTQYYNEFLKLEEAIDEFEPPTNLNTTLMQRIEYFSKQRDTYIILTAAFYILNLLDANVSAHFIDFDISEDLTLNFKPIMNDPYLGTPIYGLALTYHF
jgi:hypothetical protein